MRIEVNAKGSRRYEYRTGTGLSGWKITNSTFTTLTIKAAPKSICRKKTMKIGRVVQARKKDEQA